MRRAARRLSRERPIISASSRISSTISNFFPSGSAAQLRSCSRRCAFHIDASRATEIP